MVTTSSTGAPAYVVEWFDGLQDRSFSEVAPYPASAAIFSADMVVGFCKRGNLASERIDRLSRPISDLFSRASQYGIQQFVLLQDTHHRDTPEFDSFPAHCVQGTDEADTVPELRELPLSRGFVVIEKNSLNPAINTDFNKWLDAHPDVRTAIVVGNCTDLCVYQLAMHLRMRANASNLGDYQVVVPASAVDTYDLSQQVASQVGGMAHPGDFFHLVFLYHMALNGIQVVRSIR